MSSDLTWFQRLRLYANVGLYYGLTLAFAWFAIIPAFRQVNNVVLTSSIDTVDAFSLDSSNAISGKPIKLVIEDSGIDVPVADGWFDSASGSWKIDTHRAHFAVVSSLANDKAGETFIYGHNTDDVFGALRNNTPQPGSKALVHTSNGHIFEYSFRNATSVAPRTITHFYNDGQPMLIIQTCTGAVDEWRTMFRFKFERVVQ
jgi:hypothetical protein